MDSFKGLINFDSRNCMFRCYPISCLREKRLKSKRTPKNKRFFVPVQQHPGLNLLCSNETRFRHLLAIRFPRCIDQVTPPPPPGMFSLQSEPLHRTSLASSQSFPLLFPRFVSVILRKTEMECCPFNG